MVELVMAGNALVALSYAYLAIVVVRGLARSDQIRRNPLGLAAAAIFGSSAAGHLIRFAELVDGPSAAVEAVVDPWLVVADAVTFVVICWFLVLRRRHVSLAQSPLLFEDHTRSAAERRLREHAYQDAVTELPNRIALSEELERALTAHRDDRPVIVLLLDLDGFKRVNDSLGHDAGDTLLRLAARRIVGALRPKDFVARLGGDEFCVVLGEMTDAEGGVRTAQRILEALREPFTVGAQSVRVSASIGIATSADVVGEGEGPDILRRADIAMYQAKHTGKDRHASFRPRLSEELGDRLVLEQRLRDALDRGDIGVEYQPVVELGDQRVVGYEALARWTRDGVPIPPDEFVPAAEDSGLIVPLGYLVLQRACRRMAQLRSAHGDAMPWVAVNLSGRQLEDPHLVEHVAALLSHAQVPADRLMIEITERVASAQGEAPSRALRDLQLLGVRIALDDFGTGLTSLGTAASLEADMFKIDRSFIADLADSPRSTAVVRTAISLAQALQRDVVAEGVETASQVAALKRMGCTYGQGFHWGAPAPAPALAGTGADEETAA